MHVCVYSNSRNDVPRVAQRYGTIAAQTGAMRPSSLFVVFCVHMHSFAGLIRRTPPPTFSDTAITARPLIPLISSSELTGCGYPGLLDRKIVRTCAPGGSRTLDYLHARRAPYPLGQALRLSAVQKNNVSYIAIKIPRDQLEHHIFYSILWYWNRALDSHI